MGQLDDGFRRTVTSFKNKLNPSELQEIQCNSLSDLNVIIQRMQYHQRDRKEMMNLRRLQGFLEAMSQFQQVIEVFLNVHEFVAFIWGPIKFLLQIASTWAESFDTLLDAYEQIGEQIPLLQQYHAVFQGSPFMLRVLNFYFDDIMEFHQRAIRFFADRAWKQVFKSMWKNFDIKFKHILDNLRRHKSLIESQAAISHFAQYQHDRLRMDAELEQAEDDRARRALNDALQWLCSSDNTSLYEAAREARNSCPGSGSWILEETKLRSWRERIPANPIFWLNGIPGAGKSVLASTIIEDFTGQTDVIIAHFYCSGSDTTKNTCIAILRGLLSQLLSLSKELVPYFNERRTASGEVILSSINIAKQLLELLCERLHNVVLVIDGLDECTEPERGAFLTYMTTLVEKRNSVSLGALRILIASQIEGDIKKRLAGALTLTVSLEHNGNDIRTFVDQKMIDICDNFDLTSAETEYVSIRTCSSANGMFLFAKLVMDNLRKQPTKGHFRNEISSVIFPKDLKQAYERILTRIKSRTKNDTSLWLALVKLLGWMTCAKRPLRWHEIQAAASVHAESQELRFDEKRFRFDIEDNCGSLILMMPGNRLNLVHATAKQYILETELVSALSVECHLTTICLDYLVFPAFDLRHEDNEFQILVKDGQLAFHDYAIANWTYHVLAFAKAASTSAAIVDGASSPGFDSSESQEKFESALTDFFEFYAEDFQSQKIHPDAKTVTGRLGSLSTYEYFEIVWSYASEYANATLDVRNVVGLPIVKSALTRSRTVLEALGTVKKGEKRSDTNLDQFYGTNRFKCPKVTCFWFHEGFSDHKTRQTHVSRHERPFRCEVADCSAQDLGLKNAKDLEKHMKMFHPALDQQEVALFTSTKTPPTKTPYACHKCSKRFTRKFHLTSHMHNHNNEKPYACTECGRAFTRDNDRKRHEKIHTRRG